MFSALRVARSSSLRSTSNPLAASVTNTNYSISYSILRVNNITINAVRNKIWRAPYGDDLVKLRDATLDQRYREAIDKHMKEDPNRVIMVHADDDSKRLTVRQLKEQRDAVASYLTEHKFSNNFTACTVLPNCIPFAVFNLATMACGGVLSGVNLVFTKDEIQSQLNDCGADIVLTIEPLLEKVMLAAKESPKIRKIICVRTSATPLPDGVDDWFDVLSSRGFKPKNRQCGDDLAVLPYSSGTTGKPKGVMLTHNAYACGIEVMKEHFVRSLKDSGRPFVWHDEPQLHILPFYHVFGFSLLNNQIITGGLGVIFPPFDPKLFLEVIQKYKSRYVFIVPPIVNFIAKSPLVDQYDISSLELVYSGAAPVGKDLADKLEKRFPKIGFRQAYGMSETTIGCIYPVAGTPKDSVGVVGSTYQLKIVDAETGAELDENKTGEICIRGPGILSGYYNNEEATKDTIKKGWLHTGDVGYVNENGNTFIVDRIKELIKVKGMQVAPAELEDILLCHPGVLDAAVVGVPDDRMGEAPKAWIVKKDEQLTAEEVMEFMKGRVAAYKQLVGGVEFVASVPRSAAGKILRVQIRTVEEEKRKKLHK